MEYSKELIKQYANICASLNAAGHPMHGLSSAMLNQLLERIAELEKDAAKNKVDAECFRWWVHEAAVNPSLVAKAISHCITEDEYRDVICGAMEAKNAAIDAAMQKD